MSQAAYPRPPLGTQDEWAADDWFSGPDEAASRTWSSVGVTSHCDMTPERLLLHRARAVLRAALTGYHGR
jgi:hypothetical protein